MRLIGTIKEEKSAFAFQAFLAAQKIEATYEPYRNPASNTLSYNIWVVNEDDFDLACNYFEQFQKDPSDPIFSRSKEPPPPPTISPLAAEKPSVGSKWRVKPGAPPLRGFTLTVTSFFIMLCVFLFMMNLFQQEKVVENQGEAALVLEWTKMQRNLFFDYPKALENYQAFLEEYPIKTLDELKKLPPEAQECFKRIQNVPIWMGLSELIESRSLRDWDDLAPGTLFYKIRQGEYWRLFTPVLLHGSIMHILLNMFAFWILGKQVEERIGKLRMLAMIVFIGVISNVAQYLMGGPFFLGFSGIVVGLAGFIWVRQKKAPWEGYPLARSALLSIAIFVLILMVGELIFMLLKFFKFIDLGFNIANTAHITGGLLGMLLGLSSLFTRRVK